MAKTEIVRIRMEPEQHARYAAEAEANDMTLGPYLLQRLEEGYGHESMLQEVLASLSRLEKDRRSAAAPAENRADRTSNEMGLLAELLLLTRQVAGPQKMKIAQNEVDRVGLPVWQSGDN